MLPIGWIAWPSGHSTLSWNDDNEEDTEDVQFDFHPNVCIVYYGLSSIWISTFARLNGTELELEGIFFSRHEIFVSAHVYFLLEHTFRSTSTSYSSGPRTSFFLIRQCFDWTLFFRIP